MRLVYCQPLLCLVERLLGLKRINNNEENHARHTRKAPWKGKG